MLYTFAFIRNMSFIKKVLYCFCWLLLCAATSHGKTLDDAFQKAKNYYEENSYALAQEKCLEVILHAEADKNAVLQVQASMLLARCYYFLIDHKSAYEWSYYALRVAQKNSLSSLLIDPNYFLGVLYIEDLAIDSAEKYTSSTIALALKNKDFTKVSQTYSTLAELHLNTSKDSIKIEQMIALAENYAIMAQNISMLAFAKSKRYNYAFFIKKNYVEALQHINEAESLYLQTNNNEAILNTYRGKAECLIMLRDTVAKSYMLRWFEFKDSLLQAEKSANIAKFEALYETEKKKRENIALQKENQQNKLILIIAVSLLLLILAAGMWFYNRMQLKSKNNELLLLQKIQGDKERIARDLHDNIGGQLSYIIYSLEGIKHETEVKRKEIIETIRQSVRSVITSLRETIWAISDSNIQIQDFSDKLKVFARALFKHSNVKIEFNESINENKELNALLGLNLFRICQEILNNAFKYADATKITIDVKSEQNKITVGINDDGVGFNPLEIKSGHYGLQNIQKRASEFNIKLDFMSEPQKGTKYMLTV